MMKYYFRSLPFNFLEPLAFLLPGKKIFKVHYTLPLHYLSKIQTSGAGDLVTINVTDMFWVFLCFHRGLVL